MKLHLMRLLTHPLTKIERYLHLERGDNQEWFVVANPNLAGSIKFIKNSTGEFIQPKEVSDMLSTEEEVELFYFCQQEYWSQCEESSYKLLDSLRLF